MNFLQQTFTNHFSKPPIFHWIDKLFAHTAKRILERRGIQTSSSFVKIWLVCIPEFKANFLFFWHLYGLVFYLESIGVRKIMIWWLAFEKKAIAILVGNWNWSLTYLNTAVLSQVFNLQPVSILSFSNKKQKIVPHQQILYFWN